MPGVVPGGSNAAGQVYGAQANSQEVYVEGLPITNSVVQGEVRTLSLGVSVEAVDNSNWSRPAQQYSTAAWARQTSY